MSDTSTGTVPIRLALVTGFAAGALLAWWTPLAALIGGGVLLLLCFLAAEGQAMKVDELEHRADDLVDRIEALGRVRPRKEHRS